MNNLEWMFEHDYETLCDQMGGQPCSCCVVGCEHDLGSDEACSNALREWLLSEHKANVIDGETNGIADGSPLVDEPPKSDAIAHARWRWKYRPGTKSEVVMSEYNCDLLMSDLDAIADMIERDYVSRKKYDGLKVYRDTWENMASVLEAERDEWKAKAEAKSAKRAAAVERLKANKPHTYYTLVRDAVRDYDGMCDADAFIDLLADEPMDAQRDSNGTCPDDNETRPDKAATGAVFVNGSQVFPPKIAHATNEQIGGFNAPKSAKNADNGATKGEIRDFDVDSREQLEADVRQYANPSGGTNNFGACWEKKILEFLDRQESITERELCKQCEWPSLAAQPDQEAYDRIAELQQQVDELSERKCPGYDPKRHYCKYHAQDFELNGATVRKLKRENAELRRKVESLTEQNGDLREEWRRVCKERTNLARDLADSDARGEKYRALVGQMLDATHEIRRIADANMPEGAKAVL